MFGNQLLNNSQLLLGSQGGANQFGNALMGNMINSAQIPGNFQSAMQNVGAAIKPIGQIAGAVMPFMGPAGMIGSAATRGMQGNQYGWSA